MNTLNYKVLLTKIVFILFIRSIGIYLLITLPALAALPVMYGLSALYAMSFGWIAAIIFLLLFFFLNRINITDSAKYLLLCVSILLSVAIAFQMMEITGAQCQIWQSGAFLLFPLAAVISGWISLVISKNKIKDVFTPDTASSYERIIDDALPLNKPSANHTS